LGAAGPVPQLATKLRLFGQFVGDWEIHPPASENELSLSPGPSGEVHFGWILGGTGIQDVWGPLDPVARGLVPQGTTLRFYDSELGAWRSTWISPYQRAVRPFIGRKVGREIILKEQGRGWRGEHWIFSDITPHAFRWRAERKATARGPRRIVEQYRIARKR
jgi:hypothetical protein